MSSLAVLAAGARQRHDVDSVAACIDARKGETYLGIYQFAEDRAITSVIADQLVDPLIYRLDPDRPVFAAGPGWASYPNFAGLQGSYDHGIGCHHKTVGGRPVGTCPNTVPTRRDRRCPVRAAQLPARPGNRKLIRPADQIQDL